MARYRIDINGNSQTVNVEPGTPLLWVLRDSLHMYGAKYGCGIAQCGACTVHLDGVAVRSCSLNIEAAAESRITTIEGLAGRCSHHLRMAWQQFDVAQCGYCQAGQLMTATALLEANSRPTDAEINSAMSGCLCRCGTYPRIRKAIKAAADRINNSAVTSAATPNLHGAQYHGE